VKSTEQPVTGAAFALDPQLAHDTLVIGDLPLSRVLLMNDANFPWLIIVPRRAGTAEVFDLTPADQMRLMAEIARVGELLKEVTGCDKINTAAIGNIVPQLHVHIIARSRSDAAWPRPAWGALPACPYDEAARECLLAVLRKKIPG
jgi:diadenosine tetraphosphate (Ap4A) HIT family hydrolase